MKTIFCVVFAAFLLLAGCVSGPPLQVNPSDWQKAAIEAGQTAAPKSLVLVFDGSGSMRSSLYEAKTAIGTYVKALPVDISLGLVVFDERGLRKVADLSTDRELFQKGVQSVVARDNTPLGEAVETAYLMLAAQAKKLNARGEYHLVVVTDGEADSNELLENNVKAIVGNSPVKLFTIGFKIGTNHVLNRPGPQVRYVSADNEAQLRQGLQKVLAETEP